MESEGSLPSLQEPATSHYPEPDVARQQNHTLFHKDAF
jgi:hypothetical protein